MGTWGLDWAQPRAAETPAGHPSGRCRLPPTPPPPCLPLPTDGCSTPAIAGKAETIRMALAAAGVEFDFEVPDREVLKSDLDQYPFLQIPRWVLGARAQTRPLRGSDRPKVGAGDAGILWGVFAGCQRGLAGAAHVDAHHPPING